MANSSVIVPAKNNPGFDICTRNAKTLIAIEMRWSEGSTSITLSDIVEKQKLLPEGNVVLVVLAYRDLAADVKPENLPPRVMVLDWQRMRELYGPTLAGRPQFWVKGYCMAMLKSGPNQGEICEAEISCNNCKTCKRHCTTACKGL